MTQKIRYLTGITTTGTPHLGNFVGSVRPSVQASLRADVESFYFLADYHGLIKCGEPDRIQRSTLEIAATWLAAGLDPSRVTFYRQSDVPEIPELMWLLTCVTGKGLLNRAHAYKASVDKNTAAQADADDGVTAGLFMYPVLMAADILLFSAQKVPVGRDQIQHIEMARDIAASFNHLYANEKPILVQPEFVVNDDVPLLPGLDGRKMSKSYDNTIPLFAPADEMRKKIMGIVTDSRAPGEPKVTSGSAIFQLYQAFASAEETRAFAQDFAKGIAWGTAKEKLFERIDAEIAPMRAHYADLMNDPEVIEGKLKEGAEKARAIAEPLIREARKAVGIRPLRVNSVKATLPGLKATSTGGPSVEGSSKKPVFKQYREKDGLFYFNLSTADGAALLNSKGFANPREAADLIAQLKQHGPDALAKQFADALISINKPIEEMKRFLQTVKEMEAKAQVAKDALLTEQARVSAAKKALEQLSGHTKEREAMVDKFKNLINPRDSST